MGITRMRMGDATGGGSWAPMTGGNTLGTTPPAMAPYDPTAVRPAARVGITPTLDLTSADFATAQANQVRICAEARRAVASGSPIANGLLQLCGQARAANMARGIFVAESGPVDAAYRVLLDQAGAAVLAKSPQLSQLAAESTSPRVFAWAAAVAKGKTGPGYVAWLSGPAIGNDGARLNSDPGFRAAFEGFLRVMRPTQQAAKPDDGGIPTVVLVGGGVAGALAVAWVVWKFVL